MDPVAIEEKLRHIAALEDGWCGPESVRINPMVIRVAKGVVDRLSMFGVTLPSSVSAPSDEDAIDLIWTNPRIQCVVAKKETLICYGKKHAFVKLGNLEEERYIHSISNILVFVVDV